MKIKDIKGLLPKVKKPPEFILPGTYGYWFALKDAGEKELSDFIELDIEMLEDIIANGATIGVQTVQDIALRIAKEFPIKIKEKEIR